MEFTLGTTGLTIRQAHAHAPTSGKDRGNSGRLRKTRAHLQFGVPTMPSALRWGHRLAGVKTVVVKSYILYHGFSQKSRTFDINLAMFIGLIRIAHFC